MSTNYDVVCLDCTDTHGFSRDWMIREMRNLVEHASMLASAADTFRELKNIGLYPNLTADIVGEDHVDLEWFAKHRGHKLAVIDDCGRLDGDCGRYFKCSECGRESACVLPAGHDGRPHSLIRP